MNPTRNIWLMRFYDYLPYFLRCPCKRSDVICGQFLSKSQVRNPKSGAIMEPGPSFLLVVYVVIWLSSLVQHIMSPYSWCFLITKTWVNQSMFLLVKSVCLLAKTLLCNLCMCFCLRNLLASAPM
jgi:hypothetical protein